MQCTRIQWKLGVRPVSQSRLVQIIVTTNYHFITYQFFLFIYSINCKISKCLSGKKMTDNSTPCDDFKVHFKGANTRIQRIKIKVYTEGNKLYLYLDKKTCKLNRNKKWVQEMKLPSGRGAREHSKSFLSRCSFRNILETLETLETSKRYHVLINTYFVADEATLGSSRDVPI